MARTLNEWADEVYQNSVNHGFVETDDNIYQKLMLIVQELCEGMEELRAGHDKHAIYYNLEKPDKPEGFPVEMADALIRLLCFMRGHGIDVEDVVNLKHTYNLSRPFKHGKAF